MRKTTYFLAALLLITASPILAEGNNGARILNSGYAVHHDTSPPLSEMARSALPLTGPTGEDREVPLMIVDDAADPRTSTPHADPKRQTVSLGVSAPAPDVSVPGLGQVSGVTPPDTDGNVGLDFIVQWNNLALAIWDKDNPGAGPIFGPVNGNTIFTGFGGPCETTNNGDPIVFFDQIAERWFLSQFAINQGTECIAISTTSDPQGPYHRYAFVPIAGQNNDYPHCGMWPDGYYCTYRMFPAGTSPFATFQAMERDQMLQGLPAQQVVFGLDCAANDCPDGVQPTHLQGPAPPAGEPHIFIKDWDDDFSALGADVDGYRLWEMDVDWVTIGNTTFTELPRVAGGSDWDQDMCGFFVRNCIEQPAPATSANFLDAIDELTMMWAQYRYWDTYASIVVTHTIDATGGDVAAMRWAELRKDLVTEGAGWELYQDGVFSPDSDDRWMGSIAMDSAGNIGLMYGKSSLSTQPGVFYTGREPGDPLGTMRDEVTLVAGTGVNQSTTNRWGDYSALTVDPEDDCRFWMFQEYMETTGVSTYSTRIGSFIFPSCSTGIFNTDFETGDCSAWAQNPSGC